MRHRICCKCGWVYFGVSRTYAEDEVKRFNEYFNALSKQEQDDYYGGEGSSVKNYEWCWCGNKYKNFRDATEEEVPFGSTIGPIIMEIE